MSLSKVNTDARLPLYMGNDPYLKNLNARLQELFREIANLLNESAAWSITGSVNAYTAAPTTGTWYVGDVVRKSNPVEAGSASSKYVIIGYICTVSGTPGTWLEMRTLTGN